MTRKEVDDANRAGAVALIFIALLIITMIVSK